MMFGGSDWQRAMMTFYVVVAFLLLGAGVLIGWLFT